MRIETYPVRTFCCEGHEGLTGYAGSVKVGSDGAIAGVHSGRFIRDTPGVLHLAMHHSMRFGSNQERIEICPTDNFRGLTPPNVTTHAFDFEPMGNVRCGHRALFRIPSGTVPTARLHQTPIPTILQINGKTSRGDPAGLRNGGQAYSAAPFSSIAPMPSPW